MVKRYTLKKGDLVIHDPVNNCNVNYYGGEVVDVVGSLEDRDDILEVLREKTGFTQYMLKSDLEDAFELITDDDATQIYLDYLQHELWLVSENFRGDDMIGLNEAMDTITGFLSENRLQIVHEDIL